MNIKVCGMRESDNINELIKLDIDFIGFIFHEKSSRNVTEKITVAIPNNIKKVGVFVNKSHKFILDKANDYQLDYIQLHGKESPVFCKELKKKNLKIIKAININADFDFSKLVNYSDCCDYFLFDSSGKLPGGNGISFNWELLQKYTLKTPFLLSGGINKNHLDKIKKLKHKQFVGIDINSGFEIKPAFKDINKIKKFISEIEVKLKV